MPSPPGATSDSPTEASPLLPTLSNSSNGVLYPIDPSAGLGPEGADAHERRLEDNEDGPNLERQTSRVSVRRYEGMPDVRKRMVYIMPALGIGVLLAAADQTIIVSSYGKIGSDLKALSATSWVATAYVLRLVQCFK
jgi:hypothetical protein